MLDHGFLPCVRRIADDHRTLSPVTVGDEPCNYSDELSWTEMESHRLIIAGRFPSILLRSCNEGAAGA
jgi:hypothetical protein